MAWLSYPMSKHLVLSSSEPKVPHQRLQMILTPGSVRHTSSTCYLCRALLVCCISYEWRRSINLSVHNYHPLSAEHSCSKSQLQYVGRLNYFFILVWTMSSNWDQGLYLARLTSWGCDLLWKKMPPPESSPPAGRMNASLRIIKNSVPRATSIIKYPRCVSKNSVRRRKR